MESQYDDKATSVASTGSASTYDERDRGIPSGYTRIAIDDR